MMPPMEDSHKRMGEDLHPRRARPRLRCALTRLDPHDYHSATAVMPLDDLLIMLHAAHVRAFNDAVADAVAESLAALRT